MPKTLISDYLYKKGNTVDTVLRKKKRSKEKTIFK